MLHLVLSIVFGMIAGYIAANLMGMDSSNWLKNCGLGLAGGIVGDVVAGLIGLHASNLIGSTIISVIGACIAVWVYRKFVK